MVGGPAVDPVIRWYPLMDDHVWSGRAPLLVFYSDPFPGYTKGKRLESL